MQPSSQSSPQRWNLLTPKINGKFDFRSACRKIPKTTAFILILTLILGISYMIPIFFSLAWNLIPQSRIYPCKVEFIFATHHFYKYIFKTICSIFCPSEKQSSKVLRLYCSISFRQN